MKLIWAKAIFATIALLAFPSCTSGVASPKSGDPVPASDMPDTEYVLKTLYFDFSGKSAPKEITVGAYHGTAALRKCESDAAQRGTRTGFSFWCMRN